MRDELLSLLNELERTTPATRWEAGGVSLWPLIRMRALFEIFERLDYGLDRASAPADPQGARELDRARFRFESCPRAECVFLSNAAYVKRVGEERIDIYLDPVMDVLRGAGFSCIRLELEGLHGYSPRRRDDRFFVNAALEERASVTPRDPRSAAELGLPGWEAVRDALAAKGLKVAVGMLERGCDLWRFNALAGCFEDMFRALRPKTVFLACYYAVKQMAAVQAARRLSIPVVDVQHGVQGQWHPAYGRWDNVPPAGYSVLPDRFAVWSEAERRVIDQWREASGVETHVPFVAGYPWIEQWRKGSTPAAEAGEAPFSGSGLRRILVTHQDESIFPEWIYESLAELSRENAILFRLHPGAAHRAAHWERKLQEKGLVHFDVVRATELPLTALLADTDVHVTGCSSCVLEAREFGIPSVVIHYHGLLVYREMIDDGSCLYAPDPATFARALRVARPLRRDDREPEPVLDRYAAVLGFGAKGAATAETTEGRQ